MKPLFRSLLLPAAAAILSAAPAKAQNPVESQLFPPDFLISQRDALGLSDDQLQQLQSIVKEVQPKYEALKSKMEPEAAALRDALGQTKPDAADAEGKLRTLLTDENEMKLLQLRLMLSLRDNLTTEQVDKARELRKKVQAKNSAGDMKQVLMEHLQNKFRELKTALDDRDFGNESPQDVAAAVGEIQRLAKGGDPLEAEKQIDNLLTKMRGAKPKADAASTPQAK